VKEDLSHIARRGAALGATLVFALRPAGGQLPVTRAEAERAALAAGARVAFARADTALARAQLITARVWPNPTLGFTRSEAVPKRHLNLDIPFDAPWTRGPRLASASAAVRASRLRFLSERAVALMEVDTIYTRALAADARLRLSRQTARDADSLRKMTIARRALGDASDLDVDLATVTAGQQLNVAAGDAITYASAVLTVQTLMGIPADSIAIVLADSLRLAPAATEEQLRSIDSTSAAVLSPPPAVTVPSMPPGRPPPSPTTSSVQPQSFGVTPRVAAAEASLQAAELAVSRERRAAWGFPSLILGVEWDDPAEDPPNKKMPLIGLSLPLPIFNRNQGPIAQAQAERDRARAELTAVRLATRQRLLEVQRAHDTLRVRVARDQELVVRAQRVAAKSLTAYREGASALPAVLEARRIAREVLGQYIDDLAALLATQAELRVLTQPVPPQ
jgi:cobalt-zinc-cadmium efflux system outer membrane protein